MSKQQGFTIIELIVVIAIIAVLAAIVLVNVTSYINKGKDTAMMANLSSTITASAVFLDKSNFGLRGWANNDESTGNHHGIAGDSGFTAPFNAVVNESHDYTNSLNSSCNLSADCSSSSDSSWCISAKLLSDTTKNFCVDTMGAKYLSTTANCILYGSAGAGTCHP